MTNKNNDSIVLPKFALTALLCSGITIAVSICYIALCIVALVYRYNCYVIGDDVPVHSKTWWLLVYHAYIQSEYCESSLAVTNVTKPHTVFVLVLITLGFSLLTLITSIILTVGVKNQELFKNINTIVIVYVLSWIGSLAVDLTLATHFGIDYGYLTEQLNEIAEYVMVIDQLRNGAVILMSVALKGYVALVLNAVLICLLIIYLHKYNDSLNKEQHSIRKMGALSAFSTRKPVDNWSDHSTPYNRGRPNNAFINDDDHPRSLPLSDYYPASSQSLNRSESWQHHPPSHGSRPFSYTEERLTAAKPVPVAASSPYSPDASQEAWRRDPWHQGPPVPAPDYSPHSQRRLKSALKPAGYM